MKDKSLSSALLDDIKKYLKELREWIRPVPEDPLYLKIIKGIFKAFVLLILTLFSPVILLILTITFFAAF